MATLKKMQEQAEKTFCVMKGQIAMFYLPYIKADERGYPAVPKVSHDLKLYTITVEPNGETRCNTADHKIVLSGLQLDQLATEIYDRLVTRDHMYKPECLRDACDDAALTFACAHEMAHAVTPDISDEQHINAIALHFIIISDLLGEYPENEEMLKVLEEIALGVKHH